MPREKVCTVVASRPGVMQASLRAALTSLSWVEVVGSAGDGLSALNLVRERQPDLLVIDCNLLEDEVCALLRQVKEEWPHVRCLVLTRTRMIALVCFPFIAGNLADRIQITSWFCGYSKTG